jgi:hypothetical protein
VLTRRETLSQTLTDSLHLSRPPVAIAFADALPTGGIVSGEPV